MVFFTIRIVLTAKGSSTGTATIAGLPFAAAALPSAVAQTLMNNMVTMAAPLASVTAGASTIGLFDFTGSTSVALTDADFSNTSLVLVSGQYSV
jgi:hypothetical protein